MRDKVVNIVWNQTSTGGDKVRDEVKKTYADAIGTQKKFHKESENEFQNWSEGIEKRFKRITEYIVAAFAIDRIKDFTKEAIKKAEEMQTAYNQLKFVITNVAKEGTEAYKKLSAQTEDLSKAVNNLFSPTQIAKAQTYLATIGLNSKQILQFMPRLIDIAGRLHRPLDELADTFGRAIGGGRAQELKQLGINFATTGDKVQDFNNLMKNTQQFIGGAADAMGDFASQQQIANNQIEVMQEKLGKELAPVWNALELNFLNGIDSIIKGFKNMGDTWSHLFGGGGKAESILDPWREDLEKARGDVAKLTEMQKYFVSILNNPNFNQAEHTKLLEFYNELINAISDAEETKVKADEHIVNSEHDLTKLTLQELNIRLEAAKNENKEYLNDHGKTINDMETLNTQGFEKEVQRIQKEIENRKRANDKLLELQKRYAEELKKIQDTIEELNDDTSEKGREEKRFRLEQENLQTELTKLQEIKEKGSTTEKEQAVFAEEGLNRAIEKSRLKHLENLQKIQDEYEQKAIEKIVKERDEAIELNNQYESEILNHAKRDADIKLIQGKIDADTYNKEIAKLELQAAKDKEANDKDMFDRDENLAKQQYDKGIIDKQEYENKIREIELKRLKDHEDVQDKELELDKLMAETKKKLLKEEIDAIKQYADFYLTNLQENLNTQQKANDYRIHQQDTVIQEQEKLAEQGLKNDLAFEIRRRDELTKQQIQLVEKQKKAKELEAFLNMVVKLTETEKPGKAIADASIGLAAMKIVESKYAAEGGMVEDLGTGGRRHRNKEHLVRMEEGEGIFSVDEVNNMGGKDAFYELKEKFQTPSFFEREIPANILVSPQVDMTPVIDRLEKVEKAIINKKEMSVDWEGLNMNISTRENGQVINTVHKAPNTTKRKHNI